MKIGIFYFSGTGNTKWIATKIMEVLNSSTNSVQLHSIEEEYQNNDYDLIIIGGPIYAGNMPEKLIRWVNRNIQRVEGRMAIVFSTSVGLENAKGTVSIGKKLQKKGYRVLGEFRYLLPRNFYLSGYSVTPDIEIAELFKTASRNIRNDFQSIDSLKQLRYNQSTLGMDLAAELMSVMTRFMGRNFDVSNECIKCGKCEEKCPTENIHLEKSVKFGLKCMMCTRCIHNCPTNAISYKGQIFPQYKVDI